MSTSIFLKRKDMQFSLTACLEVLVHSLLCPFAMENFYILRLFVGFAYICMQAFLFLLICINISAITALDFNFRLIDIEHRCNLIVLGL